MQRVLVPRLPFDKMRNALLVRGDAQVEKCRNKVSYHLIDGGVSELLVCGTALYCS